MVRSSSMGHRSSASAPVTVRRALSQLDPEELGGVVGRQFLYSVPGAHHVLQRRLVALVEHRLQVLDRAADSWCRGHDPLPPEKVERGCAIYLGLQHSRITSD